MQHLWSPWRSEYINRSAGPDDCVFCDLASGRLDDSETFVLFRAEFNFVVLNRYPYTTGHMMVVPNDHIPTLEAAREEVAAEMFRLTRLAEKNLRTLYRPGGVNLGMNIGASAGAGVARHIHMHVLPRWAGDVNFMTSVGDTRVLPEDLPATYQKLKPLFR